MLCSHNSALADRINGKGKIALFRLCTVSMFAVCHSAYWGSPCVHRSVKLWSLGTCVNGKKTASSGDATTQCQGQLCNIDSIYTNTCTECRKTGSTNWHRTRIGRLFSQHTRTHFVFHYYFGSRS